MNTEQLNRFDELMREKLNDFEVEPDMELLTEIHSRKNRFMRMHKLTKLIIGLAILSLGLLAGFYWSKHNGTAPKPTSSANDKNTAVSEVYTTTTVTTSSTTSSTQTFSSEKVIEESVVNSIIQTDKQAGTKASSGNNTNAGINAQSKLNVVKQKQTFSSTPKQVIAQTAVAQTLVNNTVATKTNPVKAIAVNTTTQQTPNTTNNAKSGREDENTCVAQIDYYTSYDNSFNFIAQKIDENTKTSWLFGDGTSSNNKSPKHTYQRAGDYAVTLVVTNTKTNCKAESYRLVRVSKGVDLSASKIKGTVFADAEYASKTRVDLLRKNELTKTFEIVQSTFTNNKGSYEFEEILAGNYMIKADGYKSFGGTYFGNTQERDYASSVNVFADDFKELIGYDIQLVNNAVVYNSTTNVNDTGSKWMLVLDKNNNPIASVLVGRGGSVQGSSNLPNGNYSLVDPSTGKIQGNVSVGDGAFGSFNPSYGGLGFGLGNGDEEGEIAGAGAQPPVVNLSPNPAINFVKVQLANASNSPIEVTIMNTSGAVIRQFKFDNGVNSNTIDINSLSAGTYYVIVRQNGASTSSVLIKTDDR